MIEVKREMDFDDLMYYCWGQALTILREIYDKDKEDDLMELLEMYFGDEIPSLTEINDYLAYEWEDIYEQIGMNEDDDEDEDEDEE